MPYDETLDARISDVVTPWGATHKKMFGGTGYLLAGNLMTGVWHDSLIVRLPPEDGASLLEWLLAARAHAESLPPK